MNVLTERGTGQAGTLRRVGRLDFWQSATGLPSGGGTDPRSVWPRSVNTYEDAA